MWWKNHLSYLYVEGVAACRATSCRTASRDPIDVEGAWKQRSFELKDSMLALYCTGFDL